MLKGNTKPYNVQWKRETHFHALSSSVEVKQTVVNTQSWPWQQQRDGSSCERSKTAETIMGLSSVGSPGRPSEPLVTAPTRLWVGTNEPWTISSKCCFKLRDTATLSQSLSSLPDELRLCYDSNKGEELCTINWGYCRPISQHWPRLPSTLWKVLPVTLTPMLPRETVSRPTQVELTHLKKRLS